MKKARKAKKPKLASSRKPIPQDRDQAAQGRASRLGLIRWTIEQAASEFGLNPRTVAQRVKSAGVVAGNDGRFSTFDIHRAICGDLEREKLRKLTEEADDLALGNARERKELVDKADFLKRLEPIYVAVRQKVMGSSMPDAQKDALLGDLSQIHSL